MGSNELIYLNARLGGVSVLTFSVKSTLICNTLPDSQCGLDATGPAHQCKDLGTSPITSQSAESIPLATRIGLD